MNGVRLGIAGLGLIGGSIALRARARGARVVGFDGAPGAVTQARERAALDEIAPDLGELARRCDTLVIALPVDATVAALSVLAALDVHGRPSLIMDVASVKAPMEPFAAALPSYVGTHPLAGRERAGIGAADADLFERATWAYVPHANSALVERVLAFIAAMGARPVAIAAARHDRIVALTSHLPQALSVTLGAQLAAAAAREPAVMELCGPGIRSMLRLARSPRALWQPIVSANATPIVAELRSIVSALTAAADGLEQGDSAALMSYFEAASSAAGALEERLSIGSRS